MIELLTKLGEVLKEVPEFALWIMMGLLFYKVLIVGSWFGLVKLFILKLHDFLSSRKRYSKVDIRGKIITFDSTPDRLLDLFDEMKNLKFSGSSNYIHENDISYVLEAIREKKIREGEKKAELRELK